MTLGILPRRDRQDKPPKPPAELGKRKLSIAIVGLMLLVALVAGVWLVVSPSSNNTTAGNGVISYAQAADAGDGAGAPAAGPCNFPTTASEDVTAIVPKDIAWALSPGGPMAAPTAPGAGPLHTTGGIASCFARTPSGVLLAVANLAASRENPTVDLQALVDQRVLHSTGYAQLNQQIQGWPDSARRSQPPRQITGYRFLTFDTNYAVIELVIRNTSGDTAGAMATMTYPMAWSDDDWKMVPPVDGGGQPSIRLTAVEPPYVAWSGA